MVLFEKFKRRTKHTKESYSEEQKELKFIIQQNQVDIKSRFLGKEQQMPK